MPDALDQALRPPALVNANESPNPSERSLIAEAKRGSPEAVDAFVKEFWPDAYRAALFVLGDRAEAEDVAQESMLTALKSLPRFRGNRAFAPWLHRIVVNRSIDAARARARRVGLENAKADEARTHYATLSEADEDLIAAVRSLDPDLRAVVALRFLLGYGTNEIADLLELPRGTVGSRMRRALDALRAELEAEQ